MSGHPAIFSAIDRQTVGLLAGCARGLVMMAFDGGMMFRSCVPPGQRLPDIGLREAVTAHDQTHDGIHQHCI